MTERQYGILGTALAHLFLMLLLLFAVLKLTEPLPNQGGLLINFGDVESAGGPTEPALSESASPQPREAAPQSPAESEEGVMTQDFEKAPAIKKEAEKKKTEKKPEPKTQPKATTPPVTKPVEKPATVNPKALYSNKGKGGASTTESGTSEGIYKGSGNMGSPTGSPESENYSAGVGGGTGIIPNLNGRNPLHLQKPDFNIMKEGIVVVEIRVGRDGKVISATPGVKGSTIVDNTLYLAAKKAALQSKFNLKEDAAEIQSGTISYHFKLQ
jgi:outer membrane biosynthesis protein TonB